jgi:hypothetical protein
VNIFKPGDSLHDFEVVRALGAEAEGPGYEVRHRRTGDVFALRMKSAQSRTFGSTLPIDDAGEPLRLPDAPTTGAVRRSTRPKGFGGTLPIDDEGALRLPELPVVTEPAIEAARLPAPVAPLSRGTLLGAVVAAVVVASIGSAVVTARIVGRPAPAPPAAETAR